MSKTDLKKLGDILDAIDTAGDGDTVSIADVLDETGSRSFAPLMLIPALILISPISGIIGLPTIFASVIALITAQKLIGRDHVWMPEKLRRRKIGSDKLQKATDWLRPVARFVDRHMHSRLSALVSTPANMVTLLTILGICILIPFLEVLPFVTSIFALAISLFAVGLLARDGVFTLLGYLQVGLSLFAVWSLVG